MKFIEIAQSLNDLSIDYKIGQLQRIRKDLKGLTKIPTRLIFNEQTIFENKTYAFHVGGRTEFQFNISYEHDSGLFRYGVAFSLEPNQTLPDVSILYPKIKRFNKYFKYNHYRFSEMFFWHYNSLNIRSNTSSVKEIDNDLIKERTFIFIGKYFNKKTEELNTGDLKSILETFDDLLDVYIFVENEGNEVTLEDNSGKFSFQAGMGNFQDAYYVNRVAQYRKVNAVHKDIQKNIYKQLVNKYGSSNVSCENPSGFGSLIDLVLKCGNDFIFYEIKTANSIRKCIREALPQLLEYSYWPDRSLASKLIIVSENDITNESQTYLKKLRNEFSLPIFYQKYDPIIKELEEKLF